MIFEANHCVRRKRSAINICMTSLLGCCLVLAVNSARAQQGNRDYYRAKETQDDSQVLRSVETYHIGPGIDRMKVHNYGGALQDFEFILDTFPNHPRGLDLYSDLCDVVWKGPGCDTDGRFERAIARNPTAPQTYLLYGLHLQRQNRLPQAIESYKKSISLNPNSANAHYNLALAYIDQKQFDQANQEAQISYALGIPLPGLRDKLTRANKWKPLDPEELKRLMQPPAAPSDTPAAKDTPADKDAPAAK